MTQAKRERHPKGRPPQRGQASSPTQKKKQPQRGQPKGSPRKKRRQPPAPKKPSTWKRLAKGVYNGVFYVLVLSIIGGSFLFAFSEKSSSSLFGYRFYTVLTNSMKTPKGAKEAGFSAGDIVFVRLMDTDAIKVGDVVTFQVGEGERYLTHRVVERLTTLNDEEGDFVVTKGDANPTNDPPIDAKRIIGKVSFVVPKAGRVLAFIRENLALCGVFIAALFGFVLVMSHYFFGEPQPTKPPTKRHRKQEWA